MTARMSGPTLDEAASDLRATSRAFTRANLYHAVLRRHPELRPRWSLERFCEAALAPRLRREPIEGLLPERAPGEARRGAARREWTRVKPKERMAYFPAAILVVDRPAIVDLFVASGVLAQASVAVVSADGEPAAVVAWLCDGARKGHRAPVGYLHDAGTSLYPFLLEPLATLVRVRRGEGLAYRDLGIGPGQPLRDPLGLACPYDAAAVQLEEIPPCSLVAYAVKEVWGMIPPDSMLLPMRPDLARAS